MSKSKTTENISRQAGGGGKPGNGSGRTKRDEGAHLTL